MHTFEWEGQAWSEQPYVRGRADCKVTIHHDGDYGGNVKIQVPTWVGALAVHNFTKGGEDHHIAELNVPFEAIEALVAEKIRSKLIETIENATGLEILAAVIPAILPNREPTC